MKTVTPYKIAIVGISGMLGNTLFRYFRDLQDFKVLGFARTRPEHPKMYTTESATIKDGFDAETPETLTQSLYDFKPDLVVNCIGIIKQKAESSNNIISIKINSLFPHFLANESKKIGARFIHVSTDCVFSGRRGLYSEDDLPDARDLYGLSKLLGEINDNSTLTIRTSLIGHELTENYSLLNWFLSQEGSVFGYRNAIFSGLPTVEVARIIHQYVIPNRDLHGLRHIASHPIDKYSLLHLIKQEYQKNIEIIDEKNTLIDRSLSSEKFQTESGYSPPSWVDLIKKMHAFE